jgi:hypothetical protein
MVATEAERKASEKQAAEDEKKRFDDWVKIQEKAGYDVIGTSFSDAQVVGLPEGPTHDIEVP